MRTMIRHTGLLFFFALVAGRVSAQEPRLTALAKTHVLVDEKFQVTFSLNTNGNNFKGPMFEDFNVYSGPNMSSSVSIINGNFSQQVAFSYVVSASKEGTYTIGPASISVNGKIVRSAGLTIVVSKSGTGSTTSGSTEQKDEVFLRTELSRTKCYEGESVLVTHKVYSRYPIVGVIDRDFPNYDGFWSQVLEETIRTITKDIVNINGTTYYTAVLRQDLLFPERSGTLEVKPMGVEMVVKQKGTGSGDEFFDRFFGIPSKDVKIKVKGTSSKLEVTALPLAGKPDDFHGPVGTFSISARCSKDKTKANDAVDLILTVSGKGNLKTIATPKVNFPEGIDPYEPKLTDKLSITASGMSGTNSYDFTLLPRKGGEYTISIQPFTYFDTEKKTYVTLNYPTFPLSVEKSANEEDFKLVGPHSKEELTELASDIRFIKTQIGDQRKKDEYFFRSWKFWSFSAAPPLLFFVFFFMRRKHLRENEDTALVKSRKAGRLAQKRLAEANKQLLAGNKDLFYEEVLKAMNTYISDRLHIPVADLSRENIQSMFISKNADAALIAKIISIIDTCEFARYAPAGSAVEMGNMYNDALDAIIRTEEILA